MYRSYLLILFYVLFGQVALACDCPDLPPYSKTYAEGFRIVFRGKTIKSFPCDGKGRIQMEITTLYKGSSPRYIDLIFPCTGNCAMDFKEGQEWLIYGNIIQFGRVETFLCTRSRRHLISNNKNIELSYVHSDISFEEECTLLEKEFGIQNFASNSQETIFSHQNEKPDFTKSVLLIVFSVIGFVVIYWIIKKFLK